MQKALNNTNGTLEQKEESFTEAPFSTCGEGLGVRLFFSLFFIFLFSFAQAQPTSIWLDDLPIKSFSEGIPSVVTKTNVAGDTMRLNGISFGHGVGVDPISVLAFYLNGKAKQFTATVGVDDIATKNAAVEFFVIGDKKIIFASGKMMVGDLAKKVDVDLTGIQRLGLLVTVEDKKTGKLYGNWANAMLVMDGKNRPQHIPNNDEKYILTPSVAKTPRINTAKVFGATPGNPFLFTIAATGERPMFFAALNLPQGLSIDSKTGIISGSVQQKGVYAVMLKAKNNLGEATKPLTIKIGDTIALTPPIGWNGWNSWARNIDREKVIASANAMVKMSLRDHGWTYINIDDAWQGERSGASHAIQPNEKFPRFKEMIDSIHGLGLKLGLYSTPWITSYAGYPGGSSNFESGVFPDSVRNNKRAYRYIGKYRFEKEDALQFANWGVDYLKYDWRIDLNSAERMSIALKHSGRDVLYSLSNSAPFSNAKDWARIANAYRTGPDIRDSWTSLYLSAFTIDNWAPYGGPGHWNDPDMLILGNVTTGSDLHPTRLTPDEQYSHVSIFSLLSAPLLIGCPIEQLDPFTLNLLTNDEVIAIDQDPLGKPARLVSDENGIQIWLKPIENGAYAIGLFNTDNFGKTPQSYFHWGDEPAKQYMFDFAKFGLNGKWKIRDVWRQKDVGAFEGKFKTEIRYHGVVMLRMYKK